MAAGQDLAPLSIAREQALFGNGTPPALAEARRALRLVEDHLALGRLEGRNWLVGSRPTIADIAVFPKVILSHDAGLGDEEYPAINLWQRRVRQLPGFVTMQASRTISRF